MLIKKVERSNFLCKTNKKHLECKNVSNKYYISILDILILWSYNFETINEKEIKYNLICKIIVKGCLVISLLFHKKIII